MYVYWSNDSIKDLFAILRFMEPTIFHVHSDIPPEYQRHLNAEIKTTKKSFMTGRVNYFWKQLRKDNHLLDTECMNLLIALRLGLVPMPEDQPFAVQRTLDLAAWWWPPLAQWRLFLARRSHSPQHRVVCSR